MERYVEVIGEGEFEEKAARFIAHVSFEVRAAKDETAFREVAELANEGITILREAGILDTELTEGGADYRRPWYWKKQVGQTASRKVILKVTDFARLNSALELLEPLQSRNKECKTISVEMRAPEFEDSSDSKSSVLAKAFADAQAKATKLATAMACSLGPPLQVEEGGWSKRNSGFAGDDDWNGDAGRFGGGFAMVMAQPAGAAAEPAIELARPTRTIFVKCRARFELQSH